MIGSHTGNNKSLYVYIKWFVPGYINATCMFMDNTTILVVTYKQHEHYWIIKFFTEVENIWKSCRRDFIQIHINLTYFRSRLILTLPLLASHCLLKLPSQWFLPDLSTCLKPSILSVWDICVPSLKAVFSAVLMSLHFSHIAGALGYLDWLITAEWDWTLK